MAMIATLISPASLNSPSRSPFMFRSLVSVSRSMILSRRVVNFCAYAPSAICYSFFNPKARSSFSSSAFSASPSGLRPVEPVCLFLPSEKRYGQASFTLSTSPS